jgi:hypothetical protein
VKSYLNGLLHDEYRVEVAERAGSYCADKLQDLLRSSIPHSESVDHHPHSLHILGLQYHNVLGSVKKIVHRQHRRRVAVSLVLEKGMA